MPRNRFAIRLVAAQGFVVVIIGGLIVYAAMSANCIRCWRN